MMSLGHRYLYNNNITIARSFLALCSLLTLLFNDIDHLILIDLDSVKLSAQVDYSIFLLLGSVAGKIVSIIILIWVISGYVPFISCVFHWWVAFSIKNTFMLQDGGDQVVAVLTLLLIPFCIFDFRVNGWNQKGIFDEKSNISTLSIKAGDISYFFVRLQVMIIYFDAFISKTIVPEWRDGTAIYYFLNNSLFGMPSYLEAYLNLIVLNPVGVILLTWGGLLIEFLLFSNIYIKYDYRKFLLYLGVFFHFSISLIFGLISFGFAMFGALFLLYGDYKKGYEVKISSFREFGRSFLGMLKFASK